jgi:hypothetical protein
MPLAVEHPKLRFAVGTFDTWPLVRGALRDARARGLVLNTFNWIALERVFAGKTIMAPSQKPVILQTLPFPEDTEPIVCTSGPLADCLTERLRAGARTLKEALGHWLIPRHARYFEDALKAGKILLWIRIANADEERNAYQILLATSSNSVGVHDLVLPVDQ